MIHLGTQAFLALGPRPSFAAVGEGALEIRRLFFGLIPSGFLPSCRLKFVLRSCNAALPCS